MLHRHTIRASAALAALSLAAMNSPSSAQSSAPPGVPSVERATDSLLAEYASPGLPGASLLVVRDGRVAYARGYGLAELETGVPVTPRTNFRLASLSKQFTATAVMLLVAEGRLRYDDAAGPLLPELPAYARAVTVRQLLTHTSGLPDYEEFVPDTQTAQVHDRDIPALIARAAGPRFAPGTRYAYSNTGYVLLALIVERVSGERFADFLRERIFTPLGMTETMAHEEGRTTVPHRAYGYTVDASGTRRTDQSPTSATLGDGGIYSSVADLAKWDEALERHTLVSADAQRLAWTPQTLAGGERTEYGFGWFIDSDRGEQRLRHHGESRGFTNAILRYPGRRLTVVLLTNRTGGAPWELAQRIADLHLAR
ncbi:MAG TPA: serine hydrolase domain-containing protein [Gemmatimonadaceae bacterium]|nr:serine hydrolase domain-containing protein [Gemmatimonadaceae bacterium]